VAALALGLTIAVGVAACGRPSTAAQVGPTPSAAGAPAAATGSAIPPTPTVLLRDDFADNRNRWLEAEGSIKVEPGRYHLGMPSGRAGFGGSDKKAADVAVEADIQELSGPRDRGYGVFVRLTDEGGYVFVIADDGTYNLTRLVASGGGPERVTSGRAAVNPGGRNTIRLTAKGQGFSGAVNGASLFETTETKTQPASGLFGVYADATVEIAATRFVAVVP
jgi:hypothetical protein